MTNKVAQEVTARILEQIAKGVVPWRQPWSQTPGFNMPINAMTNKRYSGVNTVLLWGARSLRYRYPHFLTFLQCQELGGRVKKGRTGHMVIKYGQWVPGDEKLRAMVAGDDPETKSYLRKFTVFNIDQCEGLPDKIMNPPAKNIKRELGTVYRNIYADEFLACTGAKIIETGTRAFYRADIDTITVPCFAIHETGADWYCTVFHELGHWTKHPTRLNRSVPVPTWETHAGEELVAELCAAFLCSDFDLDNMVALPASYLETFVKLLQRDDKAFMKYCKKAYDAFEYLRGLALVEQTGHVFYQPVYMKSHDSCPALTA